MAKELPSYKSIAEKNQNYALNEYLDTPADLDKRIIELQAVENSLIYRGLNNGQFKMYASSQRHWMQKTSWVTAMRKNGYYDFVEEIIRRTEMLPGVKQYMQSQHLQSNDMFLMALMQHFEAPSPMIDFTENLLTGLFFAVDKASESKGTKELDDYVSLYYINKNFDWVQSTVQSVVQIAGNDIDRLVRDHQQAHPNESIDVSETLDNIKHLLYSQFRLDSEQCDITFIPVGGPSLGRVRVNIPILNFSCDYEIINDRIVKQQGMFIMNNTESKPLVELMNKNTKQKMFCCLNIHKDLIPYIESKYFKPNGINHSAIYEDDKQQVQTLVKSVKSMLPPLAILMLSCDKYSDLWDDFFNLKERFWPDCPYHCYLATDTKEYNREGVDVIHFGNIRIWSICATKAIDQIKEPYIALFLEDAFIYKKIDTSIIEENLTLFIEHKMDFLTMERNRMERKFTSDDQVSPHIWRIDRHRKYGIDTSAAIWEKGFLMKELEKEDCNAWQFEVNYCKEAASEEGLKGNIFFDDRQPFNISPIEVVRVGKLNPLALIFFKKHGYIIDTSERKKLGLVKTLWDNSENYFARIPVLSKIIKFVCKLFGKEFFS